MAIRDLIPWNRGRDVAIRRGDEFTPSVVNISVRSRVREDNPLHRARCFASSSMYPSS
jgi:hypothetical protein